MCVIEIKKKSKIRLKIYVGKYSSASYFQWNDNENVKATFLSDTKITQIDPELFSDWRNRRA